jgi:hypothetical protein
MTRTYTRLSYSTHPFIEVAPKLLKLPTLTAIAPKETNYSIYSSSYPYFQLVILFSLKSMAGDSNQSKVVHNATALSGSSPSLSSLSLNPTSNQSSAPSPHSVHGLTIGIIFLTLWVLLCFWYFFFRKFQKRAFATEPAREHINGTLIVAHVTTTRRND